MPLVPSFGSDFNYPVIVGPMDATGQNNLLNSATSRVGFLFTADRSASMLGFNLYFHNAVGSVTSGIQADLYAVDANFNPTGSSLATQTFTPSTQTTNTIAWSVAYSLTSGTSYLVVVQNVHATPASNYPQLNQGSVPTVFSNCLVATSSDSGTIWIYQPSTSGVPFWPNYAGPDDVGSIMCYRTTETSQGQKIYAISASSYLGRDGLKFIFAADCKLHGVSTLGGQKTGSPTFNLCAEVCTASASVATSDSVVNAANVATPAYLGFSSPVDLTGGVAYYIVIRPVLTDAGDASNYVRIEGGQCQHVPSTIVGPLKGGFYSLGASVSFTEETGYIRLLGLVIEAVSGGSGGGGVISPRGLSGGMP